MTTPKRNEAVAPCAWIVSNGGQCCEPWVVFEKSEVDAMPSACIADPVYSQQTIDALQGEVSRLREREAELSAFVLTLWDEYTSAAEYMGEGCLGVDPYRKSQLDALNLEPPTDGR